jgi:leucyl aminopeptidase
MLKLIPRNWQARKIETLVVPVCEDREIHADEALTRAIARALALTEFSGKKDETVILYDLPEVNAARVRFVGLGPQGDIAPESLRAMAGRAVKDCIRTDLRSMCLAVPAADKLNLELSTLLEAALEGACLANYQFDAYKAERKHHLLERIELTVDPEICRRFARLTKRVETICSGTLLAREWVNTPSNDKTPAKLAAAIEAAARKESLNVETLDAGQLKRLKMGALLAVAAGSQNEPKLLILAHRPKGARQTIALVGKGITFDTGGLNLKSGSSMADMKADMSGAAAVAAALITAARLNLKLNLIGAVPLVENMLSGKATRPGDIIRSYSGKTIEIGNTDAEGRLILADAMAYAIKKHKPQAVIDLATLTGACVVALGEKIAGIFSNDDPLADVILKSAARTHERCWRMPVAEDYKELLKSDFADINNMPGSRSGGAITAALFLSEFVAKTRWVHIDIAGPAYAKKEDAYCTAGGTGFGVRLLIEVLETLQRTERQH